jgi:threonine dehydrogenase-like Zn-dependent dehydrogenase
VALCGYPCGACSICRSGFYGHCPTPLDPLARTGNVSGECCFAQYVLKPDWLLVPIPDDMTTDEASLIGCGMGPTFGAMRLMDVQPLSTVLITGLGPVGLGGVINGAARGARVIAAARNPYRAELARSLGCEAVVDPTGEGALREILELTGGRGVDGAIETTGQPLYERLAIDATCRKGQVTFLSEGQELQIHVERDLVQKGLVLRGHLDIDIGDRELLLQVVARSRPLLSRYVTHRLPLDEIGRAWELQCAGECGKILLHPWSQRA